MSAGSVPLFPCRPMRDITSEGFAFEKTSAMRGIEERRMLPRRGDQVSAVSDRLNLGQGGPQGRHGPGAGLNRTIGLPRRVMVLSSRTEVWNGRRLHCTTLALHTSVSK